MSNERKPQRKDEPHMEKQNFQEPMEEFIDDESVPSKAMTSERSAQSQPTKPAKSSSSSQRIYDVKPAGHQDNRVESFEPGVEG